MMMMMMMMMIMAVDPEQRVSVPTIAVASLAYPILDVPIRLSFPPLSFSAL